VGEIYEKEIPEMIQVEGEVDHQAACHLRTGSYQHSNPDQKS
jgi:hypothetical protein